MKILFLAANPVDTIARLQIEQELCTIAEKIHEGTHSNQLELVPVLAVRASELQAALLRHRPDIVHFSGHCSETGGIVLEDEKGRSKIVSRKALSDLFSILKANIRVVVLNACYAREQAHALTRTIDCVIGMNDAIEDRAALIFAAHFYQSLAFGCSVEEAFKLALNEFDIEDIAGAQIPELLVREGVNPAEIRIGELSRPLVEPKAKPHPAAFFSWLFASLAIILTTDVLRRFLSGDSGWPVIAATILQLFFILVAANALLLIAMSPLRLANAFVQRAARAGIFNESPKALRAGLLTGIILAIVIGLWLSLPVFAHYYNERGARFQHADPPDLSRARESYQQAVRLNPGYAPAHYNLAVVQEDLHREKAMEEYLLAIRHDSHLYAAYNNLARLYLLRGEGNDYKDAFNLLNQAVALSPPDENVQYSLNKNLGWANYLLKHYPLAETYLRRALSLRSQGAAAHCLLAYVLKEQGKAGVVDECYDCVSLAPGEKDVEANWVSDAQDCLMKGGGQ